MAAGLLLPVHALDALLVSCFFNPSAIALVTGICTGERGLQLQGRGAGEGGGGCWAACVLRGLLGSGAPALAVRRCGEGVLATNPLPGRLVGAGEALLSLG
jgi:hypothetical protein